MPKERKQSKFGSYLSIIVLSAPAVLAGLFFYPAVSLAQEINPYYGYERAPVQSQLVGRVNDFSGAFTNSFPLVVPPGRNGLQPDLALFYNSQEHNNASIFGYGWSIGIPSIERANKKGSDKLYTENFFYSSLSGELEDISLSDGTHGTYGAKAEDGNFLKYQYNTNNSWAVTDKKGTTYTFGATAASRQDDPAESTRAFKWMLTEVRDANNNFIRYEYFKDAGQIYPSKIFYTGNGVADGIFEIEFLRELRSDNLKSYKTGFEVTTNHRISEIQAKIQGAWVRKYVLNYAAGDNEVRSVLNSITESGQDESLNVITLPANNFDYQAKTPNWTQEVGLGTPTPFITAFNEDNGVRIADVNGDGLADILRSVPTASSVYLHNGSSWTLDTNWSIPLPFIGINGVDYGTRLVDINGDAIPDLVRAESGSPYKIFIQEGTTWNDYSSLWSFPEPITLSGSSDAGTRLADVNGDGLVDVLRSTDTYTKVHLHNGSGWTEDASWSIPESFVKEPNSRDTGVRLADVNGDGLADILFHDGNIPSAKAYINNGAGWTEDLSWVPPVGFLDGNSKDAGARLDDANGDGLIDILLSSDSVAEVYLNSGEGWVLDTSWATPEPFINDNNIDVGTRLADLNGDGLVDVARNTGTIDRVYFAHPKNPDLLSHMDHSKGAKEDIAYKPSADLLNPDLPFIVQTVETVTKDDSLGHLSTTAHEHTGGEYWSAEIFDRKLAGFAEVVKTDPAGNKTKEFYHQGNTTNSSQGEFSDDVSKIGKVYRTEVTHSAGNKYAQTINKWENVDLGNQRDFVKLTQKIDFSYDGNASHRDAAETYAYNDANGNLTQKVSWGEVTGSDNGTFVDAGNDKLTTAISYASNGANVVGFPSQETTTNQAGSKVKETRNYYDGLALGSVDKGNLTKQEMWKSSTSYID
ncbi:MAG TPA: FG-GAP-like repeat-containing protein, partial [Candidatus Paceibacterota bacterium]|nr:FG-GAP-like repeat-containing protein [Candidatus Paceibacterota bacterium]